MIEKYKTLLKEFPFLTVIEYAGNEYLGIMQNIDNHIATMYVYDRLNNNEERQRFLANHAENLCCFNPKINI